MFDCLANLALTGNDTRVVLHRGFTDHKGGLGLRAQHRNQPSFYSDAIDNRQAVNNLCASERDKPMTLFLTLTCNQSKHFGCKDIKQWIDSKDAVKCYPGYSNLSIDDQKEVHKSLLLSSAALMEQQWLEVREILMKYICESPEHPLGHVEKIFWRDEYQDTAGNLPHVHALICLKEDLRNPCERQKVEELVRGFPHDLIREYEIDEHIQSGILESKEDWFEMIGDAQCILQHTHSERCLKRTGPGKTDFACCMHKNQFLNPYPTTHSFLNVDQNYNETTMSILDDIGLMDPNVGTKGSNCKSEQWHQLHPKLQSQLHIPPRHPGGTIMLPCNGKLFAANRLSANLQICTSRTTSKYVASYVVSLDNTSFTLIYADAQRETNIRTREQFLHNTKVRSSQYNEELAFNARQDSFHPKGRAMSVTEMIQLSLGYPQVHTNMEFILIPTVALEERAGTDRIRPIERRSDISTVTIPSVEARMNLELPAWRQHTKNQEVMFKDLLFSPVSVDKVTIFSVRPPELMDTFNHVGDYFRWFQRDQLALKTSAEISNCLHNNLYQSHWIDGLGCVVRVQQQALSKIEAYLSQSKVLVNQTLSYLFQDLIILSKAFTSESSSTGSGEEDHDKWDELSSIFVQLSPPSDTNRLPIIVYSNIKPTTPHKFLVHLILSMGCFRTELDVFCQQSIAQAFEAAGLFDLACPEESWRQLLRNFILDQLVYYPISTRTFDQYCHAAYNLLRDVLMHDTIPISELPPVLYSSLQASTNDATNKYCLSLQEAAVMASLQELQPLSTSDYSLPTLTKFLNATKDNQLHWDPFAEKSNDQSQKSYNEQRAASSLITHAFDRYVSASFFFVKSLSLAGGPGVGKTFILSFAALAAISRGLVVVKTALMAERSLYIGGTHIHKLFCLPVHEKAPPQQLAELAIIQLTRKPDQYAFLLRLSVLCIDEIGQISAEMLATLDIILRQIRESQLFMGGVIIVSTMDHHQLRPICGHPVLLSPQFLTSFQVILLEESVRASKDPNLCRMQQIAQFQKLHYNDNPLLLQEFARLASKHFTFVQTWEDPTITSEVYHLFGRREPVRIAEAQFIENVVNERGLESVIIREAVDFEQPLQSHAGWYPASVGTSNQLNNQTYEPKTLTFYRNGIYQFTRNHPRSHFCQSQLAILSEMPRREDVASFSDIRIMAAPIGTNQITFSNVPSKEELIKNGWKEIKIGTIAENQTHSLRNGLKAF